MDRKECANGLQLIRIACIKLKGRFSAVFMGALAMTTPLILDLFLGVLFSMYFGTSWPLTIAIMLFVMFCAPLQLGYIKYFNNVLNGNLPNVKEVFSYIKFSSLTLRSIYISGLLIIMYVFGGILWMVPAGFAISAFSMVLFFIQKYEYPKLRQSMWDCAKKMMGNRLAMFAYKLIFYLIYLMLFVVAGLCLALIYNLIMDSLIISYVVAMCSVIIFIFMYTLITVYFHSSNQIFFEDVLSRDEKKKHKKIQTKVNNTDQVGDNTPEKVENDEPKFVEIKEDNIKKSSTKKSKESKKTTKNKSVKSQK